MIEQLENRRLFAITLAAGKLSIIGTTGNDIISVKQTTAVTLSVTFNGVATTYNDSLVNTIVIDGLAGNDTLSIVNPTVLGVPTVTENATILGNAGNDTITAGAGNDVITGGPGQDIMNGGPGIDTVDYSAASAYVIVTLDNVKNDGLPFITHHIPGEYDNVMDTIENVIGTAGADRIHGSRTLNTANSFNGNGGNDLLYGYAGNDTLIGGLGNDSLIGDTGNDSIVSGEGNDSAFGGGGNDFIKGDAGNDLLMGGADSDNIFGDAGDDFLDGGLGSDKMDAGDGNDVVSAADGLNDISIIGGAGISDILDRDGGALDLVISGFEIIL